MAEGKTTRLNKVLRELNISLDRAVEHLSKNGHDIEARPTTKISGEIYQVLLDGFQNDKTKKAASKEVGEEKRKEKEAIRLELEAKLEKKRLEDESKKEVLKAKAEKLEFKTVGKIDINPVAPKKEAKKEATEPVEEQVVKQEKPVENKAEEKVATKAETTEKPKKETKPKAEIKEETEAPKVKEVQKEAK